MSLREQNKLDKEARIRAAARALFAEKGFEATTTKEVAERAGVATGTVFLYVRSKEELLFLIWREEIGRVVEAAFATLPTTGLLDELMHLFGSFARFYLEDRALSLVYVRENLFAQGESGATNRAYTHAFLVRVAERIVAAVARGELAPTTDPLLACFGFFGAYLLALIALLQDEFDLDGFEATLRGTLGQQLQGLHGGKR